MNSKHCISNISSIIKLLVLFIGSSAWLSIAIYISILPTYTSILGIFITLTSFVFSMSHFILSITAIYKLLSKEF